jgi:hypothetical protein
MKRSGSWTATPGPYSFLQTILRRLNLWPRLVIGVSLGFLVLLAVISVLILRLVDDSRDRILEERLVIAQLAARQVDSALEHDFTGLEEVAAAFAVQGVAPGSSAASDQMARILTYTGDMWLGLYLLDANGNPIAAAPARRMDVPLSRTTGSVMPETMTQGDRAVSLPYVDGLTGTPTAMLTVPVGDLGEGAGVFLAASSTCRGRSSGAFSMTPRVLVRRGTPSCSIAEAS